MVKKHTIEGLYFPVLVITKPTTIAAGAVVNVNGKIATPDSMGLKFLVTS
jgi:hypothetical protein